MVQATILFNSLIPKILIMESKNTQHRQAQKLYYQAELSQQQIADILNVNRKTLYTWIKEGSWQRAKRAAACAPTILAGQYYDQLALINRTIAMRDDRPFPTKDESEVIRRLTTTLKYLPTAHRASESIEVFELFIDKLKRVDHELVKTIMPHIDEHISYLFQRSEGETMLADLHKEDEEDIEYREWLAEQDAAAGVNDTLPADDPQ